MTDERRTEIVGAPERDETYVNWERVQQIIDETDWSLPEEEIVPDDPYLYVMGLDPGGTSGVAMLRIDPEDDSVKPELVYLHQIEDGRYGFYDWFHGSKSGNNLVIVSEKWKERNIKGADREPQYIEGMEYAFWTDNIVWQYPDQKELIPDEWLEKNNLWTPGKRHQMDALKHAFAYLRNQGHSATLESLTDETGETEPMAQPGEAEGAQISPEGKPEPAEPDETGEGGEGESGEPTEGEGEGGGTEEDSGNPMNASEAMAQAMKQSMEKLAEAMKQAGEAAEGAGEAMGGFGNEIAEGDPDEFHGQETGGVGGGEGLEGEWVYQSPEPTGTRTRRERNGAFAGFNPEGYEEGGTTLLDD